MVAGAVISVVSQRGFEALERSWDGPGPRFVQITARYHSRCGGCGSEAPVGTRITYDRLERAPYHPSCAWVAIESTPWLLPLFDGDAPSPGQVIAHPRYGWLICVRLTGRAWADNGISAGSVVGVAARRALPEEVELARWRVHAAIGDEREWSWLDADHVGDLVEAVDEFTAWPLAWAAREPQHFVVPIQVGCRSSARSRPSLRLSAGSPQIPRSARPTSADIAGAAATRCSVRRVRRATSTSARPSQ